jgi:carbonic anhydrase/acetyltransferase-like protein (isoleucine patch superfamily)
MIFGNPAKAVRKLTPEEIEKNREIARKYTESARTAKNDYQDAETV